VLQAGLHDPHACMLAPAISSNPPCLLTPWEHSMSCSRPDECSTACVPATSNAFFLHFFDDSCTLQMLTCRAKALLVMAAKHLICILLQIVVPCYQVASPLL